MKDRLWYGDCGRRRGVCKVFVWRNSLTKRWTTAKGDLSGCLADQTFSWISDVSKVTDLNVKLKQILDDRFSANNGPAVSEVTVEGLIEPLES